VPVSSTSIQTNHVALKDSGTVPYTVKTRDTATDGKGGLFTVNKVSQTRIQESTVACQTEEKNSKMVHTQTFQETINQSS